MVTVSKKQSMLLVGSFLVLVYAFNGLMQLNLLVNPGEADFRPTDPEISGRELGEAVSTAMAGVYAFGVMPLILAAVIKGHGGTNRAVGNFVVVALHAMAMALLLTIVMKLSFSRLRPTFLTACEPDAASLLSGEDSPYSVGGGWFSQSICKGTDLNHYRRSFPSGHASSTSSAAFIFTILMDRLKGVSPTMSGFLVRSSLSVLALSFAGFVGGSRYLERHHHLSDVLAGFVVGGLVAYIVFRQSPLAAPGNVLAPPSNTAGETHETDLENGMVSSPKSQSE